jgi:hypothetical protein
MTLLETHRIKISGYNPQTGPHLFDLNSDYTEGISITDQMRRGHNIVQEALVAGIIGPDKPLLIIGAGVAGMMAAVTAAKAQVTTRVIEKEQRTFSVQFNCPSRWVCPTQYSWPNTGWDKGFYPLDQHTKPFVWHRALADVATKILREELQEFLDKNDQLKVILKTEFKGYRLAKDHTGLLRVIPVLDVTPKDPQFPPAFAMALACTGFGEENTVVQKTAADAPYTGHIFWQVDKYEDDNPPLGIDSGTPNVLISGSGDGALQDFLRIATTIDAAKVLGKPTIRRAGSAAALYSIVFKNLPAIERRIRNRVKIIEQRYRTESSSASSRHSDMEIRTLIGCCVNGEAQLEHLTLIKELCKNARVWRQVVYALDQVVRDLRHEITIKVLYPCFHISPFYGLNRFMTLLLVTYAYQRYPDVQLLYPGTVVKEIVGSGTHAPPDRCEDAYYCHGKAHRVFCASADCFAVRSGSTSRERELGSGPYNAVIVRHGILRDRRNKVLSENRLIRNTTT